jgi:hypothetical protein
MFDPHSLPIRKRAASVFIVPAHIPPSLCQLPLAFIGLARTRQSTFIGMAKAPKFEVSTAQRGTGRATATSNERQ